MPQAPRALRDKFMSETSDGTREAEAKIREAGGKVRRGLIDYTGNNPEVQDAVLFLIHEWDYGMVIGDRDVVS